MKPAPYFIFIVLFPGYVMMSFSCRMNTNEAPADVIYYYPQKNTYFDSLHSNYYYSLDGGKTWDSMSYKGTAFGSVLGTKVAIERPDTSVWVNNEAHRSAYGGVLVNIINKQTVQLARADSISRLKPVVSVKAPPPVIEKEPAPEKGLKKFFNRLFGKKKKQADDKNNKKDE